MWLAKPSVNVTAATGLLVFAAGWLAPARAEACSCIAPPPPAEARDAAAAVFEGRVVSIENTGAPGATGLRVRLAVVRTWKGADAEQLTIHTAGNSAACGYGFEPNQSYLIYAYQPDEGGELGVSLCSRTARIEDASADLAVLGSGVTPVDPTRPTPMDPVPPAAQTRNPPPARGGCASCAVGLVKGPGPLTTCAAVLAVAILRRRLSRASTRRRAGSASAAIRARPRRGG